jgi:hypothetical protein
MKMQKQNLIGIIAYIDQECEIEKEYLFASADEAEKFMGMASSIGCDFSPLFTQYSSAEEAFRDLKKQMKKIA